MGTIFVFAFLINLFNLTLLSSVLIYVEECTEHTVHELHVHCLYAAQYVILWCYLLYLNKYMWYKYAFIYLKGVFAKNYRGYRLTAKKYRWWSLLILLLSFASIRRKLLKRIILKKVTSTQIQKVAKFNLDCKKINLIPNKSFRYYNP